MSSEEGASNIVVGDESLNNGQVRYNAGAAKFLLCQDLVVWTA